MNEYIENDVRYENNVAFLKGHEKFGYNDGDKHEEYILSAIKNSKDISSDSDELESYIKDWPSQYHLSKERILAFKSLKINSKVSILEVGSGCGSITRYLGETGADVLALEGSHRRAHITRERTKDLGTVRVLCGSFADVEFIKKFDLVICNGVLEYASLFVKHNNPVGEMIRLLSDLVDDDGSLVVAIENKLGLRYFSSSKEDHTNIMFDGLEGYPSFPHGPHTFSYAEIKELIKGYFKTVEFLCPLPDYKMPHAIVREDFLELANCSELFSNTMKHDFGTYKPPAMHERLVWHEIQKSKLLKEFSNSFFLLAGNKPSAFLDKEWLGDIYSIRRNPEWTVQTNIRITNKGTISTKKSYLKEGLDRKQLLFSHTMQSSSWYDGVSVHTEIVRAFCQKNSPSLEESLDFIIRIWWDSIKNDFKSSGKLDGRMIDHNWQNAIIIEGDVVYIDCEWTWNADIEFEWYLYRVITKFVREEVHFINRWYKKYRNLTPYQMLKVISKLTGVKFNLRVLLGVFVKEKQFQKIVIGRAPGIMRMVISLFMPLRLRRYILRLNYYYLKVLRKIW